MITWKKHFIYLADYQHWANESLFESLDHLTDAARKSEQGLYFHSIHHTLDHILVVNRLWAARLRGQNSSVSFNVIHVNDWRELKVTLQKESRQFQHWLESQPDVFFEMSASYDGMEGKEHDNWVRDILTHVFNHATHHRGQISAVATSLGAPVPQMDYIYYKREMNNCLDELSSHSAPGTDKA